MVCNLCPRNCNVERTKGVCGMATAMLSRAAKHFWEEPCISGSAGSGTVFFAGCNLHCKFCQNHSISVQPHGVEVSWQRLADVFLYLQQQGAANINLVTPDHVVHIVRRALEECKHKLNIPVVYNSSAYAKVQAIKSLQGLVDVYLPDLKFASAHLAQYLCGAADYFAVATQAIEEMFRQQPQNIFENGYITRGVIVRHLVLPGCTEDSKRVLDWIANFNKQTTVSLMAQYFPPRSIQVEPYKFSAIDGNFPQLNRRLFHHEYQNVRQYFFNVGLKNGYMQDTSSATEDYLPDFDDAQTNLLLQSVPHVFGKN